MKFGGRRPKLMLVVSRRYPGAAEADLAAIVLLAAELEIFWKRAALWQERGSWLLTEKQIEFAAY